MLLPEKSPANCDAKSSSLEFVLLELANAFYGTESRRRLPALWDFLKADSAVTIIPASSELLARGFTRFADHLDKKWSLTDCVSFIVTEDLGITEALNLRSSL